VNHNPLGEQGERTAERYLRSRGYRVVARNHRSRLGEVDLICRDGAVLVFVEVKTRSSTLFGEGAHAVGPHKQHKLRRLAEEYLIRTRQEGADVRFDVLSIMQVAGVPTVEHIPGAF